MNSASLSDITFDEQDASLFLVDDARLRADALKHSVLPRMRLVMNAAIANIREIYDIEALEDSIVSVYPNFRTKRDDELQIKYEQVFVGLGGQRKDKWPGFSRKDKKPVQILPFRFAFMLAPDGIFIILENGWLKGLDTQSSEAMLKFHVENEQKINPLCFMSRMRPWVAWSEGLSILAPFRDYYQFRLDHKLYDNHFIGFSHHLPVTGAILAGLINDFAAFFPVYDSYIQMAKGSPHRLDALIAKLSQWMQQNEDMPVEGSAPTELGKVNAYAANSAELKIRVMPAMRWQVFQRDSWKCVACGRNSHDGAILHVDHVIPRSRGGQDSLDNYQTLCETCNVGKSNKDATNLRDRG